MKFKMILYRIMNNLDHENYIVVDMVLKIIKLNIGINNTIDVVEFF